MAVVSLLVGGVAAATGFTSRRLYVVRDAVARSMTTDVLVFAVPLSERRRVPVPASPAVARGTPGLRGGHPGGGPLANFYPYPFMDPILNGYPGVLLICLVLGLVLGGLAFVVAAGPGSVRPATRGRSG